MEPTGHGPNGDWAFLSRYREANAALKTDAARVVFFGDSITENWAKEPFIAANSHYIGRGISGQTTLQMIVRFRSDVIELRPRVVHLMAGTNDVAGNNGPESDQDIQGALQSMVQLAQLNGIRVVLASIPPAEEFNWHPGLNPAPRIRLLNQWLKSYASQARVTFVDYWPVLATAAGALKPQLTQDGVHPNAQGYLAMAPLTEQALQSA